MIGKKHIQIGKARRGLTFSFSSTQAFHPGVKYHYTVTKNEVLIVPNENGERKISRKITKSKDKALFDLRNKKIQEFIKNAEGFDIEIQSDCIVVRSIQPKCIAFQEQERKRFSLHEFIGERKRSSIIIPYQVLQPVMLKVAGSGWQQMTIAEYLSGISISDTTETVNSVSHINSDLEKVYGVISLFSGAGMLDWPFHKDPAFSIRYALDYEPSACASYRENIGNQMVCGDIRNIDPDDIPDGNVVIGGPSCKPYSNANRRKRMDEHEDIDCLAEYLRITKAKHPDIFVIENIPELLSAKDASCLDKIFSEMADYKITAQKVTDYKVGGYTNRVRAIIIGSRIGRLSLPDIQVLPVRTVKEALAKVDASWFNYEDLTVSSPQTVARMKMVRQGHNFKDIPELAHLDSHSGRYKRLHPDEIAPTLVNWRKLPLIHPYEDRTLTVAEASALMGFEKDFKFLGTLPQRQQQVANGVTYSIGKFIKDCMKKLLGSKKQLSFA